MEKFCLLREQINLPSPADNAPLIPVHRGKGPLSNTTHIRSIVQTCFDHAIQRLAQDDNSEESELLMDATVHWLRHTGISDDVKIRPREHVRDDAGHSFSAITDKYIDIELKERHKSAKTKRIRTPTEKNKANPAYNKWTKLCPRKISFAYVWKPNIVRLWTTPEWRLTHMSGPSVLA